MVRGCQIWCNASGHDIYEWMQTQNVLWIFNSHFSLLLTQDYHLTSKDSLNILKLVALFVVVVFLFFSILDLDSPSYSTIFYSSTILYFLQNCTVWKDQLKHSAKDLFLPQNKVMPLLLFCSMEESRKGLKQHNVE